MDGFAKLGEHRVADRNRLAVRVEPTALTVEGDGDNALLPVHLEDLDFLQSIGQLVERFLGKGNTGSQRNHAVCFAVPGFESAEICLTAVSLDRSLEDGRRFLRRR